MKSLYLALTLLIFFACNRKLETKKAISEPVIERKGQKTPAFQTILDSTKLLGSVLIYDHSKDEYYSNDFVWAEKGHLPASTFKIPNSIIGLETGVVENESTVFKWDGKKRRIKNWEQDMTFRQAFHYSCYPCYQEVARAVGVDTMKTYLAKLGYEGMVVDSSSIDNFWLENDDSKISQFQQIDFLKRFYFKELPISSRTDSIMRRLMVIEETDEYTLSGKTGWSLHKDLNNGWFVGYLEKEGDVFFFATNVSPTDQFNMKHFAKVRKDVSYAALKELDILK